MYKLFFYSKLYQATIIVISLLFVATPPAWSEDKYQEVFDSMKNRQKDLEIILLTPGTCLGEGLDGFLRINHDCSAKAKELAEKENKDRKKLYQLMAFDMEISEKEVGRQRALRYLEGYPKGLLREVKLASGEITWWDGVPPHPGLISRVLTLQYARIMERPDSSSAVLRDNLRQYEAFGVVDEAKDSYGELWYKVTEEYVPKIKPRNWNPRTLGWIAKKDIIPWRRALVMRFTNPHGRDRSVFFQNPEAISNLIRMSPDRRKLVLGDIQNGFKSGKALDGAMAIEPLVGLGQEQMIMYPVLDFYSRKTKEDTHIDGRFARLLEVAAQIRRASDSKKNQRTLPIDVVFVMDTTNSMKPYLEMTLQAAREFARTSENNSIRFGFIGYQDKKSKGFNYEVKSFNDYLQPASEFVHTLDKVSARNKSVKGDDIPESVFEGINTALDSTLWREKSAKIIFLVGDAPGRKSKINIQSLRDKAFTKKIEIFAFHIKNSKVSARYDRKTKKQYTELSSTFDGAYGTSPQTPHLLTVDAKLAGFDQIISSSFNEVRASFNTILGADNIEDLKAKPGSLTELVFQQAMLYLPNESFPEKSISGWVSDKVLTNPGREALAPMILLTASELNELEQRVRELKEIGEKALRGDEGTTLDFFELVKQNTKFTMVNPKAVDFKDAFSVPLGIDQLPYESDIMATTRDEFYNPDRVQEFIRKMGNKLRHYEDLRRRQGDSSIWKKLSMNAYEQDRVVGVELNQLP